MRGEGDKLARAIHDDYVRRQRAKGQVSADDPSSASWDTLPETLRESNRRQAADIDAKLAAVSCEAVAEGDSQGRVFEFSRSEIEHLAKLEHQRWMEERLGAGWSFGPTKDVGAKHSPFLVPWDDLTEEIRDLDRDTVRGIPQFLATVGFVVVRR